MSRPRIAIVGAGVSGLSVGVCLAETLEGLVDITIFAQELHPSASVASYGAGAIFTPGGTYTGGVNLAFERASKQWSKDTFDWLVKIHESGNGEVAGVKQFPALRGFTNANVASDYKELLVDFKMLSPTECRDHSLPSRLNTVWSFKTFVVDVTKYLPWLLQKFRKSGGLLVQQKVHRLGDLDYDIVINCCGLGAKELANDPSVYPVRGHMVAVWAPWIKHIRQIRELDLSHVAYVFPRGNEVILGGTAEPNVWSTEPDPHIVDSVYHKCLELCPQLKGARILRSWACLRPVRDTVRVEIDEGIVSPVVIHNYGHGGQGYQLSWGCAKEVVKFVTEYLRKNAHLKCNI